MIRNPKEQTLFMDFSNLNINGAKPSDIDLFFLARDGFLLLGEIKNRCGHLGDVQRRLLSTMIDSHKYGGMAVYVTHTTFVQYGGTSVDVATCDVEEYYYKGVWRKPKQRITMLDIFEWVCERRK